MAQHYWDTCDGAKRAKGDPDVKPRVDTQRWVEGNDKVKVLSAIGHQTLHRLFAIVESDDYADVQALFTDQMWNDPIEVLPVNDRLLRGKTSENGPSNHLSPVPQNVPQILKVSCVHMKRIGTNRHRLEKIKGLAGASGTHGDKLKNRWG